MIEEPVEKASDSVTKPKDGVAQITISSASRDRCTAAIARRRLEVEREVAACHRIERIAHRPREAQRLGRRLAVDGEGRAGQRRRAQRAFVHPRLCRGEALRSRPNIST